MSVLSNVVTQLSWIRLYAFNVICVGLYKSAVKIYSIPYELKKDKIMTIYSSSFFFFGYELKQMINYIHFNSTY